MRRIPLLALLAACGNEVTKAPAITTFEQAAEQAAKGMAEFGEILDGVEDVASAEAAVPRLEALAKRLRAVVAAIDRMPEGDPGPEAVARMEEAVAALSPSTTAYTGRELKAPEIGDVLAEAYGEVQDQIKTLRGMLLG